MRRVLTEIFRPGGFYVYMKEDHGSYFPFPLSKFFHECHSIKQKIN